MRLRIPPTARLMLMSELAQISTYQYVARTNRDIAIVDVSHTLGTTPFARPPPNGVSRITLRAHVVGDANSSAATRLAELVRSIADDEKEPRLSVRRSLWLMFRRPLLGPQAFLERQRPSQ